MSNVYAIDLAAADCAGRRTTNEADTGPERRQRRRRPRLRRDADARLRARRRDRQRAVVDDARPHTRRAIEMAPGYEDGTRLRLDRAGRRRGRVGTLWALDARHRQSSCGAGSRCPRTCGATRGQLRRRAVASARVRRRGRRSTSASRNPVPFPGTDGQPWGSSRPGPNQMDQLDRQARRRAPADSLWATQVAAARPLRLGPRGPGRSSTASTAQAARRSRPARWASSTRSTPDSGRLLWKRAVGMHNGHDDDSAAARCAATTPKIGSGRRSTGLAGAASRRRWRPTARPSTSRSTTSRRLRLATQSSSRRTRPTGTGEMVALDIATRTRAVGAHAAGTAVRRGDDLERPRLHDDLRRDRLGARRAHRRGRVEDARCPPASNAPRRRRGRHADRGRAASRAEGQQPELVAYRLDASGLMATSASASARRRARQLPRRTPADAGRARVAGVLPCAAVVVARDGAARPAAGTRLLAPRGDPSGRKRRSSPAEPVEHARCPARRWRGAARRAGGCSCQRRVRFGCVRAARGRSRSSRRRCQSSSLARRVAGPARRHRPLLRSRRPPLDVFTSRRSSRRPRSRRCSRTVLEPPGGRSRDSPARARDARAARRLPAVGGRC